MKYLVISLTADRQRLLRFREEFPSAPWKRVQGVEASQPWWDFAASLGWTGDILESHALQAVDGRVTRPLWGTIGCAIAHRMCLTIAATQDGAVIFPDDAVNPHRRDIYSTVAQAIEDRPEGCGWIKLKNHFPVYSGEVHRTARCEFRRLARVPREQEERANTGSGGVVVLADTAAEILDRLPKLTSNHVDHDLRSIVDDVSGGCWQLMGTGFNVTPESRKVSSRRIRDRRA